MSVEREGKSDEPCYRSDKTDHRGDSRTKREAPNECSTGRVELRLKLLDQGRVGLVGRQWEELTGHDGRDMPRECIQRGRM